MIKQIRKVKYIFAKILKKMRGKALKNVQRGRDTSIESGSTLVNVNMGNYSYCGYDCNILFTDIGSFTSISDNVIIGGFSHPINFVTMSPCFLKNKDSIKTKFSLHEYNNRETTHIGNDVWIGSNVLIKQGVNIGDESIIGMGSVVTKDVKPYEIVAGNPAKHIRYRFEYEIIEKLLNIKWWNFDFQKLSKYSKYFNNVNEFINEVENNER